jgi:hypothetical protein
MKTSRDPIKKSDSEPVKKSDSDPIKEHADDKQGIDFLQALQVGGGIIAAVAMVWIILRFLNII